ncbi:MAG: diguanylate cyclase [Oscillospiraceae bacterium]|nr:diguanylate cyclase [Oscillospiraceae bacterium]
MNRKQIAMIILMTVSVIAVVCIFIISTIHSVNNKVTQYCYDELQTTSERLASKLYDATEMDRTLLSAVAEIIASENEPTDDEICRIMRSYNTTASYVTYVEILRPDNTIMYSDGKIRDVSDKVNFSDEAGKGMYISDIEISRTNSVEKVIRNAVPVVREGKTEYILYGVVSLSELAQKYKTDLYDGHAYVYLIDGNTGNFILDSWHQSPGNMRDFSTRKTLTGYNFDQCIENMKYGVAGNLGFISVTTGEVLYLHYNPVGVNNWIVAVTVEEKYALKNSRSINTSLYVMAGVIGLVLLFYMLCVIITLFRAYCHVQRLGSLDQTTGLCNRNAYDKYISEHRGKIYQSVTCVFVDVNGLHEVNNKFGHKAGDQMLHAIADAIKKQFKGCPVFRMGGDEFVVFSEKDTQDECGEKMERVHDEIEQHGYHIAAGIVTFENEQGLERIIQEADKKMLENKRVYYLMHDRRSSR